jgi:long-subunit fatty acid transport protein
MDLQIGNTLQAQKILQTIGFVSRLNSSYFLRSRLNFKQVFDFITKAEIGNKSVISESFTQNDYNFTFVTLEPECQYRFNTQFRAGFKYNFSNKDERQEIRARLHSIQTNLSYRQKSSSNLNFEMAYTNIDYNGSVGTSLELILLEGLKDGNNFTWNIGYTRRMANNIDISLFYNGRKPGSSKIVHVANAQIKATF